MEVEMAISKRLIPSREWGKAPVRPEKEGKCGGFMVRVIADR
jgi:hypothetical protein